MGELINGRTPEDIKKALGLCPHFGCKSFEECAYEDVAGCPNNLMMDALALIERLESEHDATLAKVPKWISVKEELPVKQCRVIVRTGHNMVAAGWRSYHVDVKGGELWEVDEAHNYRNDVTHWMPLPEPPEEE